MLAGVNLCPHYSNELKSIYKALYQPDLGTGYLTRFNNLDPYILRARCTMPWNWTMQSYLQNFTANGGWEALIKLGEPQNNFYGSFLMAMNEVDTQRSQGQAEDIIEAITGAGMLSRRGNNQITQGGRQGVCNNNPTKVCSTDPECVFIGPQQGVCSEDSSITCSDDTPCSLSANPGSFCVFPSNITPRCVIPRDDCAIRGLNDQCIVHNDILTPGRVLSQVAGSVIQQELAWVTNVHEMGELISIITNLLMRRILNLSKPDATPQEPYFPEPYPGFIRDNDYDIGVGNPGGGGPLPPPSIPECQDQVDNDGDGGIDFTGGPQGQSPDADCFSATDTSESGTGGPVCNNNGICDTNAGESIAACPNTNDCIPPSSCQPSCNTSDDRLSPGETLDANQFVNSANGRYQLVLQGSDGNLVIYDTSTSPWTSIWDWQSAQNVTGNQLEMNTDGRLIMYNNPPNFAGVINSSAPGAYLVMEDNGNAVIYSSTGISLITINNL